MPGRLGPGRNLALHKPEGDGSRAGVSTERFVMTRKPSQHVAPGTGWLCQVRLLPWSGGSPADEPRDDGVEAARIELPQCHPFGVGQGPLTDNPHTEAVAHVRQDRRPAADLGAMSSLLSRPRDRSSSSRPLRMPASGSGRIRGKEQNALSRGVPDLLFGFSLSPSPQ